MMLGRPLGLTDDEADMLDRDALTDACVRLAECHHLASLVSPGLIAVHACHREIAEIEGRLWWRQQMRDLAEMAR